MKLFKTIVFGSMVVGGIVGLVSSLKRKPIQALYYAQTSEWYHKNKGKY